MGTYVLIEPDVFSANFKKLAKDVGAENRLLSVHPDALDSQKQESRYDGVRRPVRGIQVKSDTYAVMQVQKKDGSLMKLLDAGSLREDLYSGNTGYTENYSNFILSSVQESRAEKMQVVLTFGQPYVFFYGEQPRFISCSGVLLNSADFNWRAEFWENYNNTLRGTKCVESQARVILSWDNILVSGYMTQASASEDAENPNTIRFEFQFLLADYVNTSNIGDSMVLGNIPAKSQQEIDTYFNVDSDGGSTFEVRKANLLAELQRGREGGATFGSVLNAVMAGDTRGLLGNIPGFNAATSQLRGLMRELREYLGKRTIRIPSNFMGQSVYNRPSVSLNSLAYTTAIKHIKNGDGGTTTEIVKTYNDGRFAGTGVRGNILDFTLNGTSHYINITNTTYFTPPVTGRLNKNTDEYVAKIPKTKEGNGLNTTIDASGILKARQAKNVAEGEKLKSLLNEFGIKTDPPNELTRSVIRAAFFATSMVLSIARNVAFADRRPNTSNINRAVADPRNVSRPRPFTPIDPSRAFLQTAAPRRTPFRT